MDYTLKREWLVFELGKECANVYKSKWMRVGKKMDEWIVQALWSMEKVRKKYTT